MKKVIIQKLLQKPKSENQKANSLLFVVFFVFFTVVVISSCEKKTNWNLKSSQNQFLIVDGIITNEYKNQTINLSLSFSELNGSKEMVNDAIISVSDGNNVFLFYNNTEIYGTYVSETKFLGVVNKTYKIKIKYNNKEYFAEASMLPVAISSPLPYKQVADTNLFYIARDIVKFSPNEASMSEIALDRSEVAGYENLPANKTSWHLFFYNLKTIDVNQIFHPTQEKLYFPSGTKMTQKKYSLSPNHEAYIRSILAETQWHGGYFDVEEGNAYTNLSEGALGYFGACSVVQRNSRVE